MTPDTPAFLSRCAYNPKKRGVVVEFTNGEGKAARFFAFSPRVYVANGYGGKILRAAGLCGARNFAVEELGNSLCIKAATSGHLNEFSRVLENEFGIRPLLLEPERQFLLERGWSYFDGFDIAAQEPQKLWELRLPDAHSDSIGTTISSALSKLLKHSPSGAAGFAERIALSWLSGIAPELSTGRNIGCMVLEKALFRSGISGSDREASIAGGWGAQCAAGGLSELDFSCVWSGLLTADSMNIGPDTIMCGCCMPAKLDESNVAPNSLVNVRFAVGGVYFESNSAEWARRYHAENQGKAARIAHMREWCLQSIPAGPFDSGEIAAIPLADAKELLNRGMVESLGCSRAVWFCKKEGALSAFLSSLNSAIAAAEHKISSAEKQARIAGGIYADDALGHSVEYCYFSALHRVLLKAASEIYVPMLTEGSFFYDEAVADALLTAQSALIRKFCNFAEESGSRQIAARGRVFVSQDSALALAKGFASAGRLPQPKVVMRG